MKHLFHVLCVFVFFLCFPCFSFLPCLSVNLQAKIFYVVPPCNSEPVSEPVSEPISKQVSGDSDSDGSIPEDGTQAAPFRSLERARDAVRAFRKAVPEESVCVELAGGVYTLEKPFILTPEDSGTKNSPIVWRGADGEKAVISGGRTFSNWRDEGNGVFSAEYSSEKLGPDAGTQLFLELPDGTARRAIRARAPNYDSNDPTASFFWARDAVCKEHVCMKYRLEKGNLDPYCFDSEGKILPDVQFVTFQCWSNSYNRIASYDSASGTVIFPRSAGSYYLNHHFRWYVENCRAALDAPGEWFFDRNEQRLFYVPRADEDLKNPKMRVILTVCPRRLLEIRGDWKTDAYVEWISFENITFSYSDADLSPDYENSVQAAHTQRGAFDAIGWRNGRIENCEFSHLGENGISLLEGSCENVVRQNHVFDVGAGGICIPAVPNGVPDDRSIARGNLIENNLIHHTGSIFYSACGIFLGGIAQNNRILHNDISNTTWAGMQLGWSWGSEKRTRITTRRRTITYTTFRAV